MALTDEELLQQLNILANRTDQNSNMVYKANAILNKGLNPDFFSGQSTKIVNALNDLAQKAQEAINTANAAAAKINTMVIDNDDSEKALVWEELQELMGKGTLVEGLKEILLGQRIKLMLDLKEEDVGKILSVAKNDSDGIVVKAIEMIGGGEGSVADLIAENVKYEGNDTFKFANVKEALDFILNNGFIGEGSSSEILWDDIIGKPEFANNLILSNGSLTLQSESGAVLATVGVTTDMDIDSIINEL